MSTYLSLARWRMVLGLQDVKRYQRTRLFFSLLGSVLFCIYCVVWVIWPGAWLLQVTEHRWLGLPIYAASFGMLYGLLTLPVEFYSQYVVEHRYEQSNQTIGRWLCQLLKGWGVGAVVGGILLSGLYACLWYSGDLWWLWVWLSWIVLAVVLAQLFPVLLLPLFYKSRPLEDEALCSDLDSLAGGTGIRVSGVYALDLSEDTKAANAMLTGLGSTRRVYLSDTLLDAFTPPEIMVVFAHELGHHVRHHIWKSLLLSSALATLNIAVLIFFLHGSAAQDWRDSLLALPRIALALTVIGGLIQPIQHAVSRHFERQCDRDALAQTRDPASYRSAFGRLAEMNLADPDPHPFVEWYFHDHPAIAKRLALADDFDRHHRTPA